VFASGWPTGRVAWIGVGGAALAAAGLFAAGWGFPLNASRTERVFAESHPNLVPPIHCRAGRQELGGLFEKVYVCYFRNADASGFPIAVNDTGIVQEWP
jgi:hypothetical protein